MFPLALMPALLLAAPLADAEAVNAIATLQQLNQDLTRDKGQQDWKGYLSDPGRALIEARRFVAMGQIHPLLNSAQFEPLRPALETQIARNQSEVAASHARFSLSDPGLLPEDIDYDAKTGQFFVTSIIEQKIVMLVERGVARDFASSPHHWPMMALKVDSRRRRLWATEVALEGFTVVPVAEQGRSILLEYDLDHRKLLA